MDSDRNRNNTPDDIDLFNLIDRALLFFRKYKWIFIIAVIAGLAAGFYFYKKIPTTYSSRMVVHSYLLTNPEEIQIINNWNQLMGKREYKILSEKWNCSEDFLRKVKSIKAKEIQQVFNPTNPHGFTIDVVVTDNSVLDSLQSGIIYGFENNEYIRERLAVKRAGFHELIEKTTAEIIRLDSTKKRMENIIQGKASSNSALIIDGSSINRQLIEMNEKLVNFKSDLQFTRGIYVLQSFSKFSQPSGPKLIPWLIMGLGTGLVLAYICALFISIREGLRRHARSRNHAAPK